MTFDYEWQMVEGAEKWLHSQVSEVKREFATPWGICDLVGCSLNKSKVRRRLKYRQVKPIGPQLRVMILSSIPDVEDGESITSVGLQNKFSAYWGNDRIIREINQLTRDRFIAKTDAGEYQKLNGWAPLHKRLIAVELKLTRVNDALNQAINNLGFADESYVGLPMETAERLVGSRKKEAFANRGIGILGINTDTYKVLLRTRPLNSSADPIMQMHSVERFWRTYPKGN